MILFTALLAIGMTLTVSAGEAVPVTGIRAASLHLDTPGRNMPQTLVVQATGGVATLGYTDPKLTRVMHPAPPEDGVQDFTFTAVPPAGVAGQAISEVTAEFMWPGYAKQAPWLKGVRVKGAGSVEKILWLKADVVVDNDTATAKAKAGQVIEVQTSVGVLPPPFPSDYAVTMNGKPIAFNDYNGPALIDGHLVVGATLQHYFFQVTAPGTLKVVVSYKRGDVVHAKTVELEVTK